ncbi:MAG: sugar phosphate isomerase/epimerase, partial [Armatimonadetes bacterium]|nr:sugar phosphate isomerase/epimerase [Armatimonadota bacterium]
MATLSLGVMLSFTADPGRFAQVREVGATSCQLATFAPSGVSEEMARAARAAAETAEVTITTFWCGWSGPAAWDFVDGPTTIGLVPAQHRATRTEELKKGAQLAAWLGVDNMASHVGFLPVNPKDQDYVETVDALKDIVARCQ